MLTRKRNGMRKNGTGEWKSVQKRNGDKKKKKRYKRDMRRSTGKRMRSEGCDC